MNHPFINHPFINVYDDPPPNPPVPVPPKTFTQDELNKILAEDRRKHKVQSDKYIQQLEELKQKSGLTEQEKNDLQGRIEELQNQNLTKEELAKKEKEKLESDYKKSLSTAQTERDDWKNKYHSSTILRSISDEATASQAYRNEQVIAILQPHTRLIEELDSDGKPTGTLIPKIKFSDSDKDGKPITLDLTVPEAIKRMKDLPERFGNLFKSETSPGLGGQQTREAGQQRGPVDPSALKDPEVYRAWREKNLKTLKRRPA